MKRMLTKTAWGLLLVLALINGVLALRYLMPRTPMAAPIPNFKLHRIALAGHAGFASIALMLGPVQFLDSVRRRWGAFHRRAGWIYVWAVGLGAMFAMPLTPHANFGPISGLGFLTLDVVWLVATAIAVRRAIQRRFDLHRRWMLRSYALTAAAISLRIMMPLAAALGLPFAPSYRAIAWLCWLVNLAMVETWIRFSPGSATQARLSALRRD